MRLLKMLGLAVVGAIAAMAFVGAGTAAAQEHTGIGFCLKYQPLLCEEQWRVDPPAGGYLLFLFLAKEPVLLSAFVEEKCEHSTTSILVKEVDKNPVKGLVEELAFLGNCKPCTTVTANKLPYLGETSMTEESAAGDYPVAVKSDGNGNPSATLEGCPFGAKCKFGTAEAKLLGLNPETGPDIHATKVPLTLEEGSAFLCGKTGEWDALYELLTVHLFDKEGKEVGLHEKVWLTLLKLA